MGGAVKSLSKAASKAVGGATKAIGKTVGKAVPRVTIGKDLGMKNIGKGATAAYKTAGKFGSNMTRTLGKGAEGLVANTNDIGAALAKGDFKGLGKEALELAQSGKDIIKGTGKAYTGLGTGALGALGAGTGSNNISKAASDINAEGNRGINKYGDAAIDMAISAVPGVGQGYALAKMAASGLSKGGVGAFTDPKLLSQLATSGIASKFGVDPTLLSGASALAQGKGLKGAALQAAGSYGGLSADNAAMLGDVAGGDVKSALMNRAGAAAGLTGAQTGVGKALLGDGNLVSSLAAAGGEKAGLSSANQGLAGQVASGDLKGAALSKLAGQVSDPTLGGIIKSGSFDLKDIIANAGKTAAMGGALPGQTYMPGSAQEMLAQGQTAYSDARNIMKDPTSAALGALAGTSAGQAVIGKGETLAAIAKKNGTTVEALLKANPNIKDANKIVAGAKLILPQVQAAARNPASLAAAAAGAAGFTSVSDKFMKDANGKTIMGANNAPMMNPNYSSAAADAKYMEQAGEGVTDLSGPLGEGVIASGEGVFNPQTGQLEAAPSMWDKIKSGLGSAATSVGGAVAGIGSAIQNNPNTANALLQGAAGVGAYMAGDKARDEQESLIKKQILETQGIDELRKYELGQDREKAYADQQKFLGDRIAGGGYTPAERAMQTEGQLRGARAAAAGRLAGVEQQARMGQGATGSGSALAASLMGAQSGANIQADVERQASAQASENLDKAYGARTGALEQKATTEMNLAQSKDTQALNQQKEINLARNRQVALAGMQGDANVDLINKGADLGSSLIYGNPPQAQQNTQVPPQVAQQPTPSVQPAPARQPASSVQPTPARQPASSVQPTPAPSPKPAALATLANPQGSTGVLAPAPTSTTPAMDAMNGFLTLPKLPSAGQAIANPQAAAKALIDQKAAQAKQIAADLAKKKAAELQASLAAKAKSALPAPVASAASKLISGFKIPGLS